MLTTFPIQSLGDAPAMVEFSRFPAALATAAEVYANLETAVRAAADAERGAIFVEYTAQMERVDTRAQRGLRDLRTTLGFPDEGSDITADKMTEHEAETSHGIVTRVLTHGIDVTAG
jgi:hypothetical protein